MVILKISVILLCVCSITNAEHIQREQKILLLDKNQAIDENCLGYFNVIEQFTFEYMRVADSASMVCQLRLKSIAQHLYKTINLRMLQNINQYLSEVDNMKTTLIEMKDGDLHNTTNRCIPDNRQSKVYNQTDNKYNKVKGHSEFIAAIKIGDIKTAKNLWSSSRSSIDELIPIIYDKNLTNAELILEFLDSLSDMNDIILGYNILYNEMKKNDDLYNGISTRITYQVMNNFKQNESQKVILNQIQNNLLPSLKNFPWKGNAHIKNLKLEENLVDYGFVLDTNRRYTLTTKLSSTYCVQFPTCCEWELIPQHNGTYFHILNKYYNNYLFADNNNFIEDNYRRRVFTWTVPNDILNTQRWQIEPIKDSEFYFKIKNIFWNEYLFLDDGYTYPSYPLFRYLFTWRSGECNHVGCKWRISSV